MKPALKKILSFLHLEKAHQNFLNYMERQRFAPNWASTLVNPFYFARKGLHKNLCLLAPRLQGNLIDVGCGTKPYQNLIACNRYDGLEIDTPRTRSLGYAKYFYSGKQFPFADNSYDSALCNQVLEHVFEPDNFMREINRVLKKNGLLLLTVPFTWDEHEQPYDYARYSSFGLKHLLSKHGFEIIEYKKSEPTVVVIFQLINCYIYKKTKTKSLYLNLLFSLFLIAPFNIFGLIFSTILPENDDLYLDNIVLAQKL